MTATARPTRGTPGSVSTPCGWVERFSTVACRTGFASTRASCTGCIGLTSASTSSRSGTSSTSAAAAALRRAYDLIVFAGHHEYVTTREYDLVEGYRDLGGNLMFLSANNYYWRVERHGNVHREVQALARPRSPRVRTRRRSVHRLPAIPAASMGCATDAGSTMAAEGNRATSRLAVRPRWRRDRPRHEGVTGSHPGGRRDPERLREGRDGADDLLRDEQRSKSVRRRRLSLHPRDHDGLRRLAALREHLGQADTMTLVRDVTRIRS